MKSPRVVLYCRVSTKPQELRGQVAALEDYCTRRGWKVAEIYQEKVSGAGAPRAELDRMIQNARAGKFDLVCVFKLDRLGRSWAHLAQIITELSALKIGLVSASQGIDTSEANPLATLTLQILSAFCEFDRDMIKERSRAGLAAARARGVKLGRPKIGAETRAAIVLDWSTSYGVGGLRAIARRNGVSLGTAQTVIREHQATAAVQKTPGRK